MTAKVLTATITVRMESIFPSSTFITLLFWAAGMILQTVLLLDYTISRHDLKRFLWCILGSFVVFISGRGEISYNVHFHILLAFVIFVFIFSSVFKKRILRSISELDVMLWLMLVVYLLAVRADGPSTVGYIGFALLGAILLHILSPYPLPRKANVMLYFLYLGLVATLGFLQFRFTILAPFFSEKSPILLAPEVAFVSGMAFLALGVHIWYMIELIPIPSKYDTFHSRLSDVKESIQFLDALTTSHQLRGKIGLFLVCTLGGSLLLNYYLEILSPAVLVSIAIVFIPYLLRLSQMIFGDIYHSSRDYSSKKSS